MIINLEECNRWRVVDTAALPINESSPPMIANMFKWVQRWPEGQQLVGVFTFNWKRRGRRGPLEPSEECRQLGLVAKPGDAEVELPEQPKEGRSPTSQKCCYCWRRQAEEGDNALHQWYGHCRERWRPVDPASKRHRCAPRPVPPGQNGVFLRTFQLKLANTRFAPLVVFVEFLK